MATPIDHRQKIADDMPTEYSASTNLIRYIQMLASEHNELEEVFCALLTRLDIDLASGALLDVIGRIVGQPRTTIQASDVAFFGFAGHPQANSFGDANDPSVGGRFRSTGESLLGNKRLIDVEYRMFIRARITKNHSRARTNDIIDALLFIFSLDSVFAYPAIPQAGFSTFIFPRRLNLNESAFLLNTDLIPRTGGTSHIYADVPAERRPFGFQGAPGAAGFGDINDSTVGGYFPRRISTT